MNKPKLTILHLYPKELNIYGDNGNVMSLIKRIRDYGFDSEVVQVGLGEEIPENYDILLAGGGQDDNQIAVSEDIQGKAERLIQDAKENKPMLVICGTYQLFGHVFKTNTGKELKGIGLFDMETIGGDKRMIGNVVAESSHGAIGRLVGFENHSGQTLLAESQQSLASTSKGYGNNQDSKREGAIVNNCIGSYLHGPVLPKNPRLADFLIFAAIRNRGIDEAGLKPIDDALALRAARVAGSRP